MVQPPVTSGVQHLVTILNETGLDVNVMFNGSVHDRLGADGSQGAVINGAAGQIIRFVNANTLQPLGQHVIRQTETLHFNVGQQLTDQQVEAKVLQQINRFRAENGLPPLVMNGFMSGLARQHSAWLCQRPFVDASNAHADFSNRNNQIVQNLPGYVLREGGPQGENVVPANAQKNDPANDIIENGKSSKAGHREAMLARAQGRRRRFRPHQRQSLLHPPDGRIQLTLPAIVRYLSERSRFPRTGCVFRVARPVHQLERASPLQPLPVYGKQGPMEKRVGSHTGQPTDVVLDIGGEGRHAGAWNLNPSRVKTIGPERGQLIPQHILGRADDIPLADGSVDRLIAERTPLLAPALREIARVISPTGTVILRHVRPPYGDPHALARRSLPGRVTYRMIWLAGRLVQETQFHLSGHSARPGEKRGDILVPDGRSQNQAPGCRPSCDN